MSVFKQFKDRFGGSEPLDIDELMEQAQVLAPFVLTKELIEFYTTCNGCDAHEIYSFEFALEWREQCISHFETPRGLLPVKHLDNGQVWVPLSKNKLDLTPVYYQYCGYGELELLLEFESFSTMCNTILRIAQLPELYPQCEGTYLDHDNILKLEKALNPHRYEIDNIDKILPNGLRNYYEFDALPDEWQ